MDQDNIVKQNEQTGQQPDMVEIFADTPSEGSSGSAGAAAVETGGKSSNPKVSAVSGQEVTQEQIVAKLRKHFRVWRVFTWALLALFAALTACVVIFMLKDKKETGKVQPTPMPIENRFLDAKAAEHAKELNSPYCKAKVEELLGWQYITLEYPNGFTVSVRNEYLRGEQTGGALSALISNGTDLRECRNAVTADNIWDIAGLPLEQSEGTDYLFFENHDGSYGFINTATLAEAVAVRPEDVMASYFQLEEIGPEQVTVKVDKVDFSFISFTHKLSFAGMGLTREGCALTVSSPVSLGEGEYIGYLDGVIVPAGDGFALKQPKFGAYVGLNYEDPNSTRVIRPIPEPIENPVVLSSSGTGRYYLPRYTEVGQHSYNWNNLEFAANGFRELYDENGKKISRMGIDVSKYNKEIDWEKVKSAGIDFAIVRIGFRGVSEGTVEEDPYAKDNVIGAKEAGLDVGVYFYTQAISEAEAVEEAEFVLQKLEEYETDITLPVVIDTELYESKKNARGNLLSREERTKCLLAFCETIEKAGYKPMVYASTRWSILNYDRDALAKYPFWFAYYGDTVSYRYDFDIWQYTSEGTVPGIEGGVDLDIMLDNPMKE